MFKCIIQLCSKVKNPFNSTEDKKTTKFCSATEFVSSRNVHYSRHKATKTNNIFIMNEFKTEIFSENI